MERIGSAPKRQPAIGSEGMSIDPIPGHLTRALAYVHLANLGGGYPTTQDLDAFATSTVPRNSGDSDMLRDSLMTMSLLRDWVGPKPDPVADYMLDLGWLRPASGGLRLTDLGLGVLRGSQAAESEDAHRSLNVVLSPDDPLQYATLTRAISEAGAGLLVDPYFKPDMLEWLSSSTNITRVLLKSSGRSRDNGEDRLFPILLGAANEVAQIEVRRTGSGSLHDRGVIHENGQVSLLGTSLTGVGKHLTAIVHLPSTAAEPWRVHMESLWEGATPIEPRVGLRSAPKADGTITEVESK